MADDDKSMRKSVGYSRKGYVVGDYKDLLESLRTEDPNYRREEDKAPVVEEKASSAEETTPLEAENIPFETQSAPVETETVPAAAETTPVEAESIPFETQSAPADTETVPAAAETIPVEAESIPFETQSAPVETETVPAAAENIPEETQSAPVETENVPPAEEITPVEAAAEAAKMPVAEQDESLIETNNLATANDTPSAEQDAPPSETERSPAESLIAANELLAAIALVLEKEKLPVEEKESTNMAEELSAAAAESSSETTEPPAVQDESVVEAVEAVEAAAAVATVAGEDQLRGVSASPSEDSFSKGSRRRKDIVYFDLTMIFLLTTISVVLFHLPNMDSFSIFFWASCMIFSMAASYNLGMSKGFIIAILTTLGYGGYIAYETMVTRAITELNFAHIAWFIFLPLGSLLTGKLSESISDCISEEGGENQDE